MTSEAKIISGIGIFTVLIIILGLVFTNGSGPKSEVNIKQESLVTESNPRITGKDAQVQIVEFGDFQCPACSMLSFTMKELFKTHGDKIDFVFRVIPIHAYSVEAASASYAAAEQGKFKEMYEVLFEKQSEWSVSSADRKALFEQYAATIGLNVEAFKTALKEKKDVYAAIVDKDSVDATVMGVQVTPTLIINGKTVARGALSYEQLKTLVDNELNSVQNTATTTQ